jgi:DNA-3-methyladenine glycosylase I
MSTDKLARCSWAQDTSPIMQRYHDREWGVPVHRDRKLLEFLILEGAQAGLSWSTILNKRPAYRRAFAGFHPVKLAGFDASDIRRQLNNPGIVRNRLKIQSAVNNAKAVLEIRQEYGSFSRFLWEFVGGQPIQNGWKKFASVPSRTAESDAMSDALRRAGFSFVGTTICYAFMQAVGMVNDHVRTCFRWKQLRRR